MGSVRRARGVGNEGQIHDRRDQGVRDGVNKNIESIKIRIPPFQGRNDLDAYIEWERKVKLVFDYHNYAKFKKEFGNVYHVELTKGLPPIRGIEHQIDFVPRAAIPNWPTYRSNSDETKELERQVDELIAKWHVRESKCAFCMDRVVFLGFVVSAKGIKVDEEKEKFLIACFSEKLSGVASNYSTYDRELNALLCALEIEYGFNALTPLDVIHLPTSLGSRMNPFEERGNDEDCGHVDEVDAQELENRIREEGADAQDLRNLHVPSGPITRAKARRIQQVMESLMVAFWAKRNLIQLGIQRALFNGLAMRWSIARPKLEWTHKESREVLNLD
ncbi:hypothetical protein CRG98_022383 [Punica granatum]|uniref:Reverse transcriptase/retrotransposon-derived protein RNase H-like domain-containing protein n=1 Tax=Punica granatum TaxID=22663 RepID=A0A2I0JLP9_PUNGR|nr:hypothetical protein CRG98_022383 [Punica granatum]